MPSVASIDRFDDPEGNAAMLDDYAREDPDNPPPMAQTPEAGSSRLEALPDELLIAIFDELGHEKNSSRWSTKSAARSAYRSLCLVSKRIDLIARPYLFKKISVSDFRSLFRLCRTIAADQELGYEISEIKLNVDFNQMTKHGNLPLTPDERNEVLGDCYQIIGPCGRKRSGDYKDDVDLIGFFCFGLLARAVNLCSLAMVVEQPQGVYSGVSGFFDHVRDAICSSTDGAATVFLPRLESLTLDSRRGTFSSDIFGQFMGLPSLTKLKSIGDEGDWFFFARRSDQYEQWRRRHNQCASDGITRMVPRSAPPNIRKLHLYNTLACLDDIEDIAHSLPHLRAFSVHTRGSMISRTGTHFHVGGGSARGLSIALGSMTALRRLKIDICPRARSGLYNLITAPLGPNKVLNLAQLPHLRQLEVPLFMFAHVDPWGLGVTRAVPRDVLPQALRKLVLIAHHECCHKDGQACIAVALDFLDSLSSDLSTFRRLKTVAYCFRRNSCAKRIRMAGPQSQDDEDTEDSPEQSSEESPRSRFQAIHASFAMQNVEFCVQRGNQ